MKTNAPNLHFIAEPPNFLYKKGDSARVQNTREHERRPNAPVWICMDLGVIFNNWHEVLDFGIDFETVWLFIVGEMAQKPRQGCLGGLKVSDLD
jgi:hypothetical protein